MSAAPRLVLLQRFTSLSAVVSDGPRMPMQKSCPGGLVFMRVATFSPFTSDDPGVAVEAFVYVSRNHFRFISIT